MRNYVTVLGSALVMFTYAMGASSATTLDPVAYGSTRDFGAGQAFPNSPVQLLTVFSFTDRGHVEFDISSLSSPVSSAQLSLQVRTGNVVPSTDTTINLGSYAGDGAITFADFSAATNFTSFEAPGTINTTIQLDFDVTAIVNDIIDQGADFVGFTGAFESVWPGNPLNAVVQLGNDPSLPLPQLAIETGPQVPLPATLPLFAGSLGVFGLLGWRAKRTAQSGIQGLARS